MAWARGYFAPDMAILRFKTKKTGCQGLIVTDPILSEHALE